MVVVPVNLGVDRRGKLHVALVELAQGGIGSSSGWVEFACLLAIRRHCGFDFAALGGDFLTELKSDWQITGLLEDVVAHPVLAGQVVAFVFG